MALHKPKIFPRFRDYAPALAIPSVYWDVESAEQRIRNICEILGRVVSYADEMGIEVTEISQALADIEAGHLDPMIIAAIEDWFSENEPEIVAQIKALEDALPVSDYNATNTVSAAIQAQAARIDDANADIDALEQFDSKLAKLAEPEYIGVLSPFRFAYNPPSGWPIAQMMQNAQSVFNVFSAHNWDYMPTSDDMRQYLPLYFTEPSYRENAQGHYVTCSGMVQMVLYLTGYTELGGGYGEKLMLTGWDFINFLESKGWTKVTDFTQCVQGAIVFQGARTEFRTIDGEQVRINVPSHDFIYISSTSAFDAGKPAYIAAGGPITYDINRYQGNEFMIMTQLQWAAIETGYYSFYGPWQPTDYISYTTQPPNEELFLYQGFVIKDDAGNIYQQFSCKHGEFFGFISDKAYETIERRMIPLSTAIAAEGWNFANTVITPSNIDIASGVKLSFGDFNKTSECERDENDHTRILTHHRGAWLINLRLNFQSQSSNTGIITAVIRENGNIIAIAHEPATNVSPYIDMTVIETLASSSAPISESVIDVVVFGGGLTDNVTIRSGTARYQSAINLIRLK